MLFVIYKIIFILRISSLIIIVIQRHHILICLLALEGLILRLFLIFIINTIWIELFIGFFILTLGACEASLGLACLVAIIRSFGNDRIKSLIVTIC